MGQRGQVAGAAQRAVLVHDRGDAGVEQGGVGLRRSPGGRRCGRWPASTGAAASARAPPRARPRAPEPAACERMRLRCRAVRSPAGSAWWPARRTRWRRRRCGARIGRQRLDDCAASLVDRRQRIVGEFDCGGAARDRDDSPKPTRGRADDDCHDRKPKAEPGPADLPARRYLSDLRLSDERAPVRAVSRSAAVQLPGAATRGTQMPDSACEAAGVVPDATSR